MDADEEHSASAAPAQMATQDNEETMLDEWSVLSLLKFCICILYSNLFFVVCSACLHYDDDCRINNIDEQAEGDAVPIHLKQQIRERLLNSLGY